MKTISALIFGLIASYAAAESVPFKMCESGDPVTIKTIDVTPAPTPGATVTITADGSTTEAITDGKFSLTVKFLGIPVTTLSGDICTDPELKLNCPVKVGDANLIGKFTVPSAAPAGAYTIEIKGTDASNGSLFCADLNVKIGAKTESTPMMLTDSFLGASTPDFEDPKPNGCKSNEQAIQILGLAGDFCSPKCSFTTACPTDVPTGTTATPTCALAAQGSSSPTNCALICNPTADAPGCPSGASCKSIQGTGICTYDD